jgi:hypothetical protein
MKRVLSSIGVLALVLAAASLCGVAKAGATSTPALTITPNTGLKNGQSVTVTGSGFAPGDSVFVVECLATFTSDADCNKAGATPATVADDGTLPSTALTLTTGAVGSGACGTTTSNLNDCVVSVANAAGADAATGPITFAPLTVPRSLVVRPSTGLRSGESVKVSGAGFVADEHVRIIECLVGAKSDAKCDRKTLKAVVIRATGVLAATSFKVFTGKIGSGTCGTTAANLRHCIIRVATASNADAVAIRIVFTRATTSLPSVVTEALGPSYSVADGAIVADGIDYCRKTSTANVMNVDYWVRFSNGLVAHRVFGWHEQGYNFYTDTDFMDSKLVLATPIGCVGGGGAFTFIGGT